MATLVIHTPQDKAVQEGKRSFEKTVQSGVGDEYAIYQDLYKELSPGFCVVVLDEVRQLRAEGNLVKLIQKSKAGNGVQRYDVHIAGLKMVPYRSEFLNRCGIAVK